MTRKKERMLGRRKERKERKEGKIEKKKSKVSKFMLKNITVSYYLETLLTCSLISNKEASMKHEIVVQCLQSVPGKVITPGGTKHTPS